ncbi:unnamed protein product [Zymoseptoria tritici ST99CH_3D7]|uniref:Uncharacterized protein n=1 Tax=Zymoseptoria tritici (strain ST99CH_3D7) TaxID=1276538 RepID=A0A1X7RG57_ZYMT9|nr:unnamed protein product [Zymoseptoria tritici ST99CH_3D7]
MLRVATEQKSPGSSDLRKRAGGLPAPGANLISRTKSQLPPNPPTHQNPTRCPLKATTASNSLHTANRNTRLRHTAAALNTHRNRCNTSNRNTLLLSSSARAKTAGVWEPVSRRCAVVSSVRRVASVVRIVASVVWIAVR